MVERNRQKPLETRILCNPRNDGVAGSIPVSSIPLETLANACFIGVCEGFSLLFHYPILDDFMSFYWWKIGGNRGFLWQWWKNGGIICPKNRTVKPPFFVGLLFKCKDLYLLR